MLSSIERVMRTNCVICDARSDSNLVCNVCETQSRNDFYLLLLMNMRDEAKSYESLKSKCVDIHGAIDHHPMITEPRTIFDPLVDTVDFHSKYLLENYTDIFNRDAVPVNAAGDGDCLFHAIQSFYPELSIDEIRARCVDELCLYEQYYTTTATSMGLELVDDESVEKHVLRILGNHQYTSVLTLAALSSVLMRPIQSVYPHVNEDDQYFGILNVTFFPRTTDGAAGQDEALRIMWSGPEQEVGRDWRPNHFVPLLTPKQQLPRRMSIDSIDNSVDAANSITRQNWKNNFKRINSNVSEDQQEVEVGDVIQNQTFQPTLDSRQLFSNGSAVIKEILSAVKNNCVDDEPPKQVTYPSKFLVKNTSENRLSVGKDGNGTWIQIGSVNATFILTTNGNYQVVRRDAKGRFHYNERIGRQYAQCLVEEKDVFILKRFATLLILFCINIEPFF